MSCCEERVQLPILLFLLCVSSIALTILFTPNANTVLNNNTVTSFTTCISVYGPTKKDTLNVTDVYSDDLDCFRFLDTKIIGSRYGRPVLLDRFKSFDEWCIFIHDGHEIRNIQSCSRGCAIK